MSSDLLRLSAADLLHLYRAKRISPVEVTRAVLQQIDTLNPVLNAFCFVAPDALAMAAQSEARWMSGEPKGLLDGVPVSIKDILLTRGWPTLRGSKTVDPAGPWTDVKEKRWTQQPAASIPCGLTRAGLPVGLHIVGPRYADARVLRAARALESVQPIPMPDVSALVP